MDVRVKRKTGTKYIREQLLGVLEHEATKLVLKNIMGFENLQLGKKW